MSGERIFISTHPFGTTGRKPLDLLEETGWELILNPHGRRLKAGEVAEHIREVDAVIAGTEPYDAQTLKDAERLKTIARVGIGLDSVDLEYCRDRGIQVTYTPDAPSRGVAEMTVANIVNLLRHIHESDTSVREGAWNRLMGRLVGESTIGVVGVGRIGTILIELLQAFGPKILACDTDPEVHGRPLHNIQWLAMDELLEQSDVVTLHIPLTEENRHLIGRDQIARMRTGAMLVNTSRGGIVDEAALEDALFQKHLGGAAVDVFEKEPYEGALAEMDNVVLTAHMGASARTSRYLMELGAAENCISVLRGEKVKNDAIRDTLG